MLRKVAMIFIAVFLRSLGTRIQAFAVFLLLLGFLVLTQSQQPYISRQLNRLEMLSLLASALTIYAGFFFLSAEDANAATFDVNRDCKLSLINPVALSPTSKWLFFLLILAANLFFLGMWLAALASSLRAMCRTRCPKFFLAFCLCGR